MATHGLRIDDLKDTNSIVLRPINSRGEVGQAIVSLHRGAAEELLVYLTQINTRQMTGHEKVAFMAKIAAAIGITT